MTTRRPFGLAFAPAPPATGLASPPRSTRRLILQKARRHPLARTPTGQERTVSGLFHSPRRGAFHRSLTVLVHYRSSTVFSLGTWSSLLPTRYHVSGRTHDPRSPGWRIPSYGTLTPSGPPFQRGSEQCAIMPGEGPAGPSSEVVQPRHGIAGRLCRRNGLGSSPFARRYSGNLLFSSRY